MNFLAPPMLFASIDRGVCLWSRLYGLTTRLNFTKFTIKYFLPVFLIFKIYAFPTLQRVIMDQENEFSDFIGTKDFEDAD